MAADPDAVAALLDRSRTRRGLPEKVDDPDILGAVAAVLVGASAPHAAPEQVAS